MLHTTGISLYSLTSAASTAEVHARFSNCSQAQLRIFQDNNLEKSHRRTWLRRRGRCSTVDCLRLIYLALVRCVGPHNRTVYNLLAAKMFDPFREWLVDAVEETFARTGCGKDNLEVTVGLGHNPLHVPKRPEQLVHFFLWKR